MRTPANFAATDASRRTWPNTTPRRKSNATMIAPKIMATLILAPKYAALGIGLGPITGGVLLGTLLAGRVRLPDHGAAALEVYGNGVRQNPGVD